ncbi:hypothetical protein VOLCADRAFT_101346 [Volvox carteri f. nagariensis]|uniref:Uncharacterized protein n=1 Tax=Volvox carteri f. nagariensis TaxID=3068 RepID=D8UME4_VOLCA|nr:uncharacterized protein VOLCADRAFT_101346 [Volvox carteri f. nagariensis]EFJ39105.1 hypothetical protein VOLCADRAFT_101346 [Volvox carteri f. nagariensis]|eukprot:XP_002959830.1 hypothetical protein VOLCADRAFT_101346 [Volvox carteri f. nagariensis]
MAAEDEAPGEAALFEKTWRLLTYANSIFFRLKSKYKLSQIKDSIHKIKHKNWKIGHSCVTEMDAAENLEQVFSVHMAAPALAVLQQLRKDLSKQQAQKLLDNHRNFLQLGTCSFGRRGQASYALRTEAEVQRLCNIANISGTQWRACRAQIEVGRITPVHKACMCASR